MRVRTLIIPLAALLALVVVPHAHSHPAKFHQGKGDLRMVRPEVGPPVFTHGGDPKPEPPSPAARAATVGFDVGDAERPPSCADVYNQHVLYARPAGSPNRINEVRGQIQGIVRRMNAVLNAESIESGGPTADFRVLCDSSGSIVVNSFTTSGTSFGQVVADARRAGFSGELSDYLIFFDAKNSGTCGIASYLEDESLSVDNLSNTGGGYALVYRNCWFTEIPMHEVGHTMGGVQYSAPHSTGTGGHCNQENDVLCYSPDGGDRNQGGIHNNCPGTPRFDCGFDDYFDSAPEPGEYLYTHWNLGSPLNRFIDFGGGGPGLGDLIGGLLGKLLNPGRKSGASRGVAGATGEWSLYEASVTRRASKLIVRLRGAKGLSLYVRRLKAPTETRFACRRRANAAGKAICRIKRPRQGKWIAGVRNDSAEPGAPYSLKAKIKSKRR